MSVAISTCAFFGAIACQPETSDTDNFFASFGNGVMDDCSFTGIDSNDPAPRPEGNGLLSITKSIAEIDGWPYPFSKIDIASCDTGETMSASWQATHVADAVQSRLIDVEPEFSTRAAVIRKEALSSNGQIATDGFQPGQVQCACALHYNIEVTQ